MTPRRFGVHVPGPGGDLGEFTLDELLDAYPNTAWMVSKSDGDPVTISVHCVVPVEPWPVERNALAWVIEHCPVAL